MEIEFAYKRLLSDEKISESELPEDARIGITTINDIMKMIRLAEKKGHTITDRVKAKLRAQDKWVVREILDFMEDKDTNKEEAPIVNTEEIATEIKKDENKNNDVTKTDMKATETTEPETNPIDPKGVAIDEELKALFEAGKTKFTLDELKSAAPKSYNVVFDNYDQTGDNGIETSHFKLIEVEDKQFELSK